MCHSPTGCGSEATSNRCHRLCSNNGIMGIYCSLSTLFQVYSLCSKGIFELYAPSFQQGRRDRGSG